MLKEGFELLKKYEIPVIDYWINEIPKNIKFPVVVKADLLHKTEYNAVKIDIKNYEELEKAFNDLKRRFPDKDIIIQKQLSKDFIETIIGAKRDPVFDYFILFGIGGVYTEILKDFIILAPPFTKEDFLRLIDNLKLKQILFGYRNKPRVNLDIIYDVILKVGKIIEENKNISEIEINPFMVNDKVGYAVDIRIIYF